VALFEYDELQGIQWTWQAMDGAMAKAPLGGEATGKNPTDRAKLGTKRSVLTDGAGVPLGVVVSGAHTPDMKLVETTLESIPVARPPPTAGEPQNMCLDKGYDFPEVRALVDEYGYTAHIPFPRNRLLSETCVRVRFRPFFAPRPTTSPSPIEGVDGKSS
jgi:putative transposase